METTSIKRSAWFVAGTLGLAGAFFAGAAYAADPKLDEAADLVTKALAVLRAAENPDPDVEFGGHRRSALDHLGKAQSEIAKAKAWADKPRKPKTPDPKPPTPSPSASPHT